MITAEFLRAAPYAALRGSLGVWIDVFAVRHCRWVDESQIDEPAEIWLQIIADDSLEEWRREFAFGQYFIRHSLSKPFSEFLTQSRSQIPLPARISSNLDAGNGLVFAARPLGGDVFRLSLRLVNRFPTVVYVTTARVNDHDASNHGANTLRSHRKPRPTIHDVTVYDRIGGDLIAWWLLRNYRELEERFRNRGQFQP